jgi:hypothetical protein
MALQTTGMVKGTPRFPPWATPTERSSIMNFKSLISTATNATKKGAITTVDVTKAIAQSPEVKEAGAVLADTSIKAAKFTGKAAVVTATAAGNLMLAVLKAGKNALNKCDNGDSKPSGFLK